MTLERNYSDAFDIRGSRGSASGAWRRRWGSSRVTAVMHRMRACSACALTWKPHPRLEVGLSRSAQWCGEGPPLRSRHVLGPAPRPRQRPAARRAAGQPDGRIRRALVAALGAGRALRAGDRRGRGQLPAEQVPRPVRCRVLGRLGRSVVARARRVRGHACGFDSSTPHSAAPIATQSTPTATSTGTGSIGQQCGRRQPADSRWARCW